jgi:ketosteroid isomerase-like protein
MIRRALMLITACGAIGACAPATQDTSADVAKLEADAPLWFDHFNKGDADAVTNLYAADAVILPAGAPAASGHAAIREYIAADIARSKAGGFAFKNGAVTGSGASGDMGWVSGTFSVTDASGTTVDSGKYVSIYQRTDDGWKLIRDIWNSDLAPAPAPQPAAAPAPAQ